jgi:hypothetical protein
MHLLGCGKDGPGFEFKRRQEIIPSKISAHTAGPTQRPAQRVEAKRHLISTTYLNLLRRLRMSGSIPHLARVLGKL